MRSLAIVVLLAACNPTDKQVAAKAAPTAPAAPAAAPHDEAAIVELSERFLRAYDDGDAEAMTAALAPDFLQVRTARFYPAEAVTRLARLRKERGFPKFSDRAFELVKVRFFGDAATFTAMTSAKLLRAEGVAAVPVERSETLTWTYAGGAWRLATWEEELAGADMDRASWNATFQETVWVNLKPNQLLVDTVHGRTPGKALDIGMGQGRNALFLAAQGWDVTGIDISDEGIHQAEAAAKAAGITGLHTVNADIDAYDWGENQYDLLGYIYMGASPPVDKIRRALKPGGIVVIEFFGGDANKGTGISAFKKGELPIMFKDGFKVVRYEEVEDLADWGLKKVPLVRFVAEKL